MTFTSGTQSRQKSLRLDGTIALTAMGAVTPVGVGIAQTICSIRSGVSRMQETAGLYQCAAQDAAIDPPEPVVAARLGFVERDELCQSEQWPWLARLLVLAFQDLERTAPELRLATSRLGLFIALPLPRPGLTEEAGPSLLVSFYNHARIDPCAEARLFFGGHAGFFALAMDACEAIRQGQIDAALVGGVDSYLFRPLLASLDEAYRLKSTRNFDGFRPAEGAGFVLLQPVRASGVAPRVLLDGLAASAEAAGEQALTEVCRRLQVPGAPPSLVICDLNGETRRAREWAIVATRLGSELGDAAALEHPAIVTGDLGAASGPVLLSCAAHALVRPHAAGHSVCVFAASDDSLRAGASLRLAARPC